MSYAWDIKGRAKWDAWSNLQDMGKEEAMQLYVEQLAELFEVMPLDDKTRDLINVLGPFYEMVFKKSMMEAKDQLENESLAAEEKMDDGTESDSESEAYCDTVNNIEFEYTFIWLL